MSVRIITEPEAEPVTLAEAIDWTRADDGSAATDAALTMLIGAMRRYAENLTGRAFVQRGLQLVLPCWEYRIELPYPPLVSVESVTYVDTSGNVQTLDAALYVVHNWREPGIIVPEFSSVWPATRAVEDAVRVNYTAGYAPVGSPTDPASGVPDNLKLWMHARIATLYNQRDQLMNANSVAIPRDFADGLLDDLVIGSRLW